VVTTRRAVEVTARRCARVSFSRMRHLMGGVTGVVGRNQRKKGGGREVGRRTKDTDADYQRQG
jgi:hypothetical protein